MQRLDVRVEDEVAGAGADPELLVRRDRRVDQVEPEQEIRHHGAVANRRFERSSKRLAAQVAVQVGKPEEDVLLRAAAGLAERDRDLETSIWLIRPVSPSPGRLPSSSAPASRSSISASSASVEVNAGESSVWSLANPSTLRATSS